MDGRVLKQSLADHSRMDEHVIGVQLAPDEVAVFGRRAMDVLVAAAASHGLHVGHPEVVAERADQPHRLLERMFDLEAQAVEPNDFDRGQRSVGAHQQAGASGGMDHRDEAHQPAGRAPQQVAYLVDDDLALAVDGTFGLFEALGIIQQVQT